MTTEMLKSSMLIIADKYHIKKPTLFGSRAVGTNHGDSDADLIMEFLMPVSLPTLSMIKLELEEMLKIGVDIVHGSSITFAN